MAEKATSGKIVFGTMVSYRVAGAKAAKERHFTGKSHCQDALDFCRTHVQGLTEEEYAKLSIQRKVGFKLRIFHTAGDLTNAVKMWMRAAPLWDWHLMQPFNLDTRQ